MQRVGPCRYKRCGLDQASERFQLLALSSLWEWGRVNPLVGSACDRFGLVPRLGAGKCWCGVGSDSTGRSTRAAGLVLTPTPFGAGLVRRERAIGVGGVAVFSDVLNGR